MSTIEDRICAMHSSLKAIEAEGAAIVRDLRTADGFSEDGEYRDSLVGMATDYVRVAIGELEEIPIVAARAGIPHFKFPSE